MYQYSFEKLEVWHNAITLSTLLYKLTTTLPGDEKFGLISQIRRAAVSISANLAEGSCRFSNKERIRFYEMSFGSLMEVLNAIILLKELDYLSQEDYLQVREKIDEVANKINALVRSQRR